MPRSVSYCTPADLLPKIPAADRDIAVDDDADDAPDSGLLQSVIDTASDEVDTFYSIRGVTVPLSTSDYPLAKQACIYLALETLYTRRGEPAERNPHHKITEQMRALLVKVAEGKLSVTPPGDTGGISSDSDNASDGDVIAIESEPSLTYPGRGRVLT
jgi:phage gp36-like protein